jgi:hypothetical protein
MPKRHGHKFKLNLLRAMVVRLAPLLDDMEPEERSVWYWGRHHLNLPPKKIKSQLISELKSVYFRNRFRWQRR